MSQFIKNVSSDDAYNHIRKKILNGEYAPGRPLMTSELSNEIGVSRTPVRDALRQLEADGLVSIRARLGASVKALDSKEYEELCGMRLALESYAAGLAASRRTEEELQEIKYAFDSMRQLTNQIVNGAEKPNLLTELIREDVRFHIAIMTAAKSELIKKEILRLHLINRVVSAPVPANLKNSGDKDQRDANRIAVVKSHEEIYLAIANREASSAKLAMDAHIQDIIDKNLKLIGHKESGIPARELTEEELSYTT